ncbi:MAG: 3-oxoacyl-ACP synthase [archaeon]|nr:3-oxoacyl-ACP synthase [archaeon]
MSINNTVKPRFESLGFYLPEKIVTTKELVNQMEKKPLFDLERITSIKERRFRAEDEGSYSMAISAAKDCLSHSKYKASEIDIIIFCSITRYNNFPKFEIEPSMSLLIKNELGATSAINFDISNACAGMLTGAYIIFNMIKSGMVKNGMVISGECITPLSETAVKEISEPIDEQFASLTVGDSGAAFILDVSQSEEEGIDFIEFMTAAKYSKLCFAMPSDKNPGPAMYTKASRLHKVAIKRCPVAIQEAFNKSNTPFEPDNYDFVIPHQTSERAIIKADEVMADYFKKKLPEPLFSLHEYGNTSTTTHFAVLHKALKENKVKKGTKLLFVSIASGIVFGVCSATMGNLEV